MQLTEHVDEITSRSPKACVLVSGGLDSTACVDFYLQNGFDVSGLFVDYGQAARAQERVSAERVADHYGIPFRTLCVGGGRFHSAGIVMGRNAFLLFTALMELGGVAQLIATGVHSGTPYYDCSRSFLHAMQVLFDGYTAGRVHIAAPFADWSKAEVWTYSRDRKVPISLTYSCEVGGDEPCGRCLSCRDMEVLRAC